jgi:hypothetical protein
VAGGGEVHADLVRAAGDQLDGEQRAVGGASLDVDQAQRGLAAGNAGAHAPRVGGVGADGRVETQVVALGRAGDDGGVEPVDAAGLEGGVQPFPGNAAAGEQHQPGGVAVDPMQQRGGPASGRPPRRRGRGRRRARR